MKNEVIQALEANNPALAMSKAKILIKEDPSNYENFMLMGDAYMGMMDYSNAIQTYQHARDIEPLDSEIYKKIGFAYARISDWDAAVGVFRAAMGLLPEEPLVKGLLGWAMWSSPSNYAQQKSYELMVQAVESGIEFKPINNSLVEYHLDQAIANWHKLNDEKERVIATRLSHIKEAENEVAIAENYLVRGENFATRRLDELKEKIISLKERSFHGYPFIRKAPLMVGVFCFFIGKVGLAVLMFILAVLYHTSQNKPKYLANQMHVKGDYGDPFWIKNINSTLRYLDSFSFYSTSFSNLMMMSFLFSLFGTAIKYMLAIIALPFTTLAGFYKNYDLFDKAVEMSTSSKT